MATEFGTMPDLMVWAEWRKEAEAKFQHRLDHGFEKDTHPSLLGFAKKYYCTGYMSNKAAEWRKLRDLGD